MTKTQEIELLDATIAKFGPHSYLGPWLKEHRDAIVSDIHNDVEPSMALPAAARAEGRMILTIAQREANQIVEKALADAKKATEKAHNDVYEIRATGRRNLEQLIGRL